MLPQGCRLVFWCFQSNTAGHYSGTQNLPNVIRAYQEMFGEMSTHIPEFSGAQAAIEPNEPPPHWGDDDLSSFMQLATSAAWASFVQPDTRKWFEKLKCVDLTFLKAIDALKGHTPNYFEGLMLVSAHAAFRGAAEFALQGRTCESMVLMRSCLEYAMYGVHFHRHPKLIAVWAHRSDGENEKKAVRKHFKANEMIDGITAMNNAIGPRAKELYDRTIDMGAHPNEVGFFSRLSITDVPDAGGKLFQVKYLQGGEPAQMYALKSTAQIGVCALECFWLIYRERYDILGIKAAIDTLKAGL